MPWSARDIPSLESRIAVVTGASSGIGEAAALELARHGAEVVLACRSAERGQAALDRLRAALAARGPEPRAEPMRDPKLVVLPLDLASLGSVRRFAAAFGERYARLDILCNNAGVMATPRLVTEDGFELQLGTNHLGHFALTGLLLPRLLRTDGARVVTVSSGMHRLGRLSFDDLHGERRYQPWLAYAQSKLANLLFAYELQRRLARRGSTVQSLACHPGYAATHLQLVGPEMKGAKLERALMRFANAVFAQSAAGGALPTLYAAVAPQARGGEFIGPANLGGAWGPPRRHRSNRRSHDEAVAAHLWTVSEQATGVHYDLD